MPAQLLALNDGPSILVDKPILLIGRHPECDVQIDSRKISRRHCCVAQVHDYLVVRDLDSTNGIRINGVRVLEGKLAPGDELTIGNHRYRVTWEDPAPHAPFAARGKASPAVPTYDDDEMLESCDEPVALPDPGRGWRPPVAATSPSPMAGTDEAAPVVLPEDLHLMPSSGSHHGADRRTPRPRGS
jgi:predicted component of type VI protein secretion system